MIENENIYKGLECYCNEFEKIPIDKRDLGIAGIVSSYTLSIGGAVANYKTNEYLQTQEVSKGIRTLSSIKITANFGILGYLIKKVEGKSDERAGTETAIETGISYIAIKTGTCIPSNRLITDENGEQFFECMSEEELQRIQKEKDKNSLKTYLLNALSIEEKCKRIIASI